jgi:4-carboxymuconolactone decarboxylase
VSRLEPVRPEDLRDDQRETFERIARWRPVNEDGQLGGPFDAFVRSPELGRRMYDIGGFLWERTTIGRRLVELAILVTARFWRSNVEWWAHKRLALEAGVEMSTIDAIFERRRPSDAPADEVLVYDVVIALHEDHQLPPDLYRQAIEAFGEEGLMEIIGTIGYYTFIAMTLNAFEVEVPVGARTPFPREDH